jgi:hypothetical protein
MADVENGQWHAGQRHPLAPVRQRQSMTLGIRPNNYLLIIVPSIERHSSETT